MKIKARISAVLITAALCIPAFHTEEAGASTIVHSYDVVKDFGAVPDDSGADTSSIQKALDMAVGMNKGERTEVYVPDGTYRIDNCLGISSNTVLRLSSKAVIINENEEKVMLYNKGNNKTGYNCSENISVTGGTWDGNAPNTSITHTDALFVFAHSKNLTISDTTLKNERASHFVICDGIDGLTVKNTVFKDFYDFRGDPMEYFVCVGETDAEKRKSAVGAVEALHIDYAAEDYTPCRNVEVTGCTFTNVPAGVGTHHMYSGYYAENILVHHNTFSNVRFSCARGANFRNFRFYNNNIANSGGMFRADGSEAEVYGNNFSGLTSIDYNVYPKNSTLYSVLALDSSSVNLHDNIIRNSGGTGVFYKNNCTGSINGNLISKCRQDGVFIENSNASITDNDISDCPEAGVRATGSTVSVIGNSIIKVGKKTFDIYKGCTSSVIMSNGIDAKAKNYYSDDSSVTVSDNGTSISAAKASLSCTSYQYTGQQIKPLPSVRYNGKKLAADKDYLLSYASNINAGKASVNIKGTGNYRGTLKAYFDIIPLDLADSKVRAEAVLSSYAYTGSAVKPEITVKFDGTAISPDEYSVTYSDNIEPGNASITVTAKSGNLTGTAEGSFRIKPDASSLSKGDISGNGVIDMYDSIEIAEYMVKKRKFNSGELKIADFNDDGSVDLRDCIAIAKHILNSKR